MSRSVNKHTPEHQTYPPRIDHQENRGPRYGNRRKQVAELKLRARRIERAKNNRMVNDETM